MQLTQVQLYCLAQIVHRVDSVAKKKTSSGDGN
jgi:hypothetical protein